MRTEAGALALAAALVACGHGAEEVVITTTPPRAPDRIAPGIPHGGFIQTVATTERADAALTLDHLGELRLWPTLDGKRPPVPLAMTGITGLALGHAGDDLFAALLDQSGAVKLLRLGRDGSVRAKVQLPGDVKIEQVAAFDGGVLVVRGDQSIERYDAEGKLRGRLLAGAGETLGALSVRHGSAAVLVQIADVPADEQPPASPPPVPKGKPVPISLEPAAAPVVPIAASLRWIVLGDELRWGTSVKLPDGIDARALALAPDHRRIAVVGAHANVLEVFDLAPLPAQVTATTISVTPQGSFGFTDDDHVAVATGSIAWWTAPNAKVQHDPWDTTATTPPPKDDPSGFFAAGGMADGAVGDGLVVASAGSGLVLGDPRATHYLGWRIPGNGTTSAAGGGFALVTSSSHVLWLDSALVEQGESDTEKLPGGAPQYAVWIDRQHVLVERVRDTKYDAELVDLAHPEAPVRIGSYATVERFEYDPELGVLSVGTTGQVARFAIDAEHGAVTPLPALKVSENVIATRLLDPARASGAIALATSYEDDGQRVAFYREPRPNTKLVRPEKSIAVRGAVLGIAATGALYIKSESPPIEISVLHDGTTTKLPAELAAETITAITPNRDASQLVVQRQSEVSLVDAGGAVRWRAPLWSVISVTFSKDEHTLLVRTAGGMVALDAATGERRAAACAFGFGLADKPPQQQTTLGVAPVCEDIPR